MDLSEALRTSIAALVSADTGTGGFNNSASNALVQKVIFRDDPNYASDRALYNTTIEVEVDENPSTIWGTTPGTGVEKGFVLLRFIVNCQRDPGRTRRDAVVYRIRTQWGGVTPAAASDSTWTFGPMSLERVRQLSPTSTTTRTTLEFSLRAGAGTVVESTGRQVSVTFAGSEGAAIGTTMFGTSVEDTIAPEMRDVTQWGDASRRRSVALGDAFVSVDFALASMTPVQPVGARAVLVVFENTAGTKKLTFTNAIVVSRRFYATTRQESQPNRVTFTFAVSAATQGTNAIVAA